MCFEEVALEGDLKGGDGIFFGWILSKLSLRLLVWSWGEETIEVLKRKKIRLRKST